MVKSYQYSEVLAHDGPLQTVQLSTRSCSVFASGATDGKLHVWAVGQPNQPIVTLDVGHVDVTAACFDANEEHVLVGTATGEVQLWSLRDQHRAWEAGVSLGHSSGGVVLWDVQEIAPLQQYPGHDTRRVCRVHFSPDGRWVASACVGGHVKLWDLTAGKLLHSFAVHTSPVTDLAYSPNDLLLASASLDGCIMLYDLDTFAVKTSISTANTNGVTHEQQHAGDVGVGDANTGVQAITFSPGSNTIIAALPGSISLYTLTDTPPTPLVTVTDVHWAPVSHMQLCDDMLVAVCSSGASVGVGVMAGMQRLMLNVRPGDHIRGSNKADPRHRALQNGVPGSPSVRTPSAAVNTVGRSPLQPEGGGARGSGSAHNGGMGSRHSHLRRSAPELVGEGGAGRSGGVRASLPASLAGVRGSRLRDAGAPVDSAMPPLNTLHIHTAAAQGPTPAQGPSATTPTAAGALNPRSPGGKGMSQWARTQRQSTGVLDAVFNGGAPMDPQDRVRSPARAGGATPPMHPSASRPLEELLPPKVIGGRQARALDYGSSWDDTIVSAVESPHNDLITTITTMNSPAGSLMDAEATAAATQQEAALLEVGRSKHHVITGALKARLTNYDTVKLFWNTCDLRGVMTALKLDVTVASDVFECFRNNRDFFTLDVCQEATHLANELLETATHDKHIAVALDVLSTYVRHYGAHIRDTCAQDVSALHHDMELEARRDTCMACRAALQGVLPQLSAAARAHEGGQLGRKAQELQDELACL